MKARAWLLGAAFGLAAWSALPAPHAAAEVQGRVAILRGLDKVTGQFKDFQAPVGKPVKFRTLTVLARACQKAAPEDPPATWAFVEIFDQPVRGAEGDQPGARNVFSGWMLASSPGLNALQHPVYDIWAIDCRA